MMNSSSFTKLLLVLLLFTFSFSSLSAQDYYESSYPRKSVSLGLTFSPNLSWLRYGNRSSVDKKAKIGYAYGLLADFAMAENYAFSTGFLINNLRASSDLGPEPISTTYDLQYVEIPFGLKLRSTQRYYRSYYGLFGFTGGIKMSADKTVGSEDKADLNSDAKAFRLGLQFGGGVEWQLDHNLRFMTGLTFNNGFKKVLSDGSAKNSYVSVNFGLFF